MHSSITNNAAGREIVAVEVPYDADCFVIDKQKLSYTTGINSEESYMVYKKIGFNCKLIGLLSELTEEQCEPYVDYKTIPTEVINYEENLFSYMLRLNGVDTAKPLLIIKKLK